MAEKESTEWIRFARDDLEAARYLQGMVDRKLEIICYHCRQSAEKALKAVYALHDMEIPKTHDFGVLSRGIRDFHDFVAQIPDFAVLQPFSVAVRYPFEIDLVAGDDERALEAAESVLTVCEDILRPEA